MKREVKKFVVVGILLFLALFSFLGGLYVGGYLMFIGGIVDVINQLKAPTTETYAITKAVAKIVFFEIPIGLGFFLTFVFFKAGYEIEMEIDKS